MGHTAKREMGDEARFPTKEEVNQTREVKNPPPDDKIEDRLIEQVDKNG